MTGNIVPVPKLVNFIAKMKRGNGTLSRNRFTSYPTDENNRTWEELIELRWHVSLF